MRRGTRLVALTIGLWAAPLGAQAWNDPHALALVQRATERRAQIIADTALADYKAIARGYVIFLGQFGENFSEPPKVIRADQLGLEVYWRAPNRSKQLILGRRDTLLLPTDINYHRDHLGIVQNNFPSIIRLGDGDEVADVPHPLSADGLAAYDFAVTDSLTLRLGARTMQVYQVQLKPKDERAPRAVGAVYLNRDDATVVRMTFSFTRAALKDDQLEDVSVVLENGLVDGRFWLPRRQEIEIRRTGTWLDFPVRGIIRGTWNICCVEVNQQLSDAIFAGDAEIGWAPASRRAAFTFGGSILDSLPSDVRTVTDAEAREVQEKARELVQAQSLARVNPPVLSARGASDLLRVNRAEGFAIGAGLSRQFGAGVFGRVGARYGTADARTKVVLEGGWRGGDGGQISLQWRDDLADASVVNERSGLANSLASQEFGSDATEWFRVRGVGLMWRLPTAGRRWRWSALLRHEEQRSVATGLATPSRGVYRPLVPARFVDVAIAGLSVSRPVSQGPWDTELRTDLSVRQLVVTNQRLGQQSSGLPVGGGTISDPGVRQATRLEGDLTVERRFGQRQRFVFRTIAAFTTANDAGQLPPQWLTFLGGPTTAPGYGLHELVGRGGVSQRLEWRTPVPFPSIPLGRFGAARGATLATYATAAWIDATGTTNNPTLLPWRAIAGGGVRHGWYPSVGVGLLSLFDVLRVDVARGLRNGRWQIGVDVTWDLWSIL